MPVIALIILRDTTIHSELQSFLHISEYLNDTCNFQKKLIQATGKTVSSVWNKEDLPQQWKELITVYEKGDRLV
jgi:hypothetical protein